MNFVPVILDDTWFAVQDLGTGLHVARSRSKTKILSIATKMNLGYGFGNHLPMSLFMEPLTV